MILKDQNGPNQEEMRTTGESVCECKDKTDNAL